MELTTQQKKIVEIPAGNILVSAAAGSGKTSVMTQRIVKRIRSHELDIRNVLVMTFTDAAARSMKEKIEKQLRDFMNEEKVPEERRYLSGQMQYLGRCNISTIHSFCLEIVRNFYYEARNEEGEFIVEPGFRIEDTGETDILLAEAIDELFEEKYEGCDLSPEDPGSKRFLRLTETYGTQRSDSAVRDMLKDFYHFVRSIPDYNSWMAAQIKDLKGTALDFENSRCKKEILEALELRIENAQAGLEEFCAILDSAPVIYKDNIKNSEAVDALKNFAGFIDGMRKLLDSSSTGWDRIYHAFAQMPDVSSLKGKSSEDKKELRRIFDRHFAELVYFGTGNYGSKTYSKDFLFNTDYVFTSDIAGIQKDILYMVPMAEELFSLTAQIDRRYARLKRESNMIDFGDFEHMALLILRSGNAGRYYKEKFREIYIDEYQDTSSIQEAVISLISNDNLFMVGDVKQSIYRFRHAKPEIFLRKYKAFSEGRPGSGSSAYSGNSRKDGSEGILQAGHPADHANGQLVELNQNFRSLEGILEAANNVFYQIMSGESGEVDYTSDHALVPFRKSGDGSIPQVELLLTDLDDAVPETAGSGGTGDNDNASDAEPDDDTGADPENGDAPSENPEELLSGEEKTSYELEAATVASEIIGLLNAGTKPGDIAVLSRTRSICGIFADTLEKHGVEVLRETGNAGPDYYEMRVAEEFLAVLDNPCQDIPLAGLMRSPFFGAGFSEDELLEMRISAGREVIYFYECCERYRDAGEDAALRIKVEEFYQKIAYYRSMSDYKTAGEILEKMYRESGLFAYASTMPEGQRRLKYLNSFRDWAHSFASARHCGLYEIVRYLEALKEKIGGESPFPIEESLTDRVRVMTIHRSKGLEYGTVFIIGSSRRLSPGRRNGAVLLSENNAPGLWYINPDKQYKYPTPLVHAVSESMVKGELAEEMRLLYVAMTRAKDRLYISGTIRGSKNREGKELAEVIAKARKYPADCALPSYLVLSAKSTLDWIAMALARNPGVDFGFLGEAAGGITGGRPVRAEFYSEFWKVRTSYSGEPVQPLNIVPVPATAVCRSGSGLPDSMSAEEYTTALRLKFFGIYPFEDAARKPLKLSAGEIKRREQADDEENPVDIGTGGEPAATHASVRSINTVMKEAGGVGESEITGAERGIAVHSFLRYADTSKLTGNCSASLVRDHLNEMIRTGMVSGREGAILSHYIDKFVLYYNSGLAAAINSADAEGSGRFFREIPFTLRISCREFYAAEGFAESDCVYVQGIIDCWFLEEGGAVLIDYKTDSISGNHDTVSEELNKRYNTQMSVYARAIGEIMGVKVKKAVIWLVGAAEAYEISCTKYLDPKNRM